MIKELDKCIQKASLKLVGDTVEHWTLEQLKALSPFELYEKESREASREINSMVLTGVIYGLFSVIEKQGGLDEAISWFNDLTSRVFKIVQHVHPNVTSGAVLKKKRIAR